jgi:hypothetical protein
VLVRELFARLGLQVDSSGFDLANALFDKTKRGLAGVGAAVGAAALGIAGAIGTAAARAGDISDLAARTGVAAETLQSLDFGAKLAGVEIAELAQSFGFLSKSVSAAANGSGEAQKAWAKAGVSIRAADGSLKSADALLLELSDKFQAMPEGVEKTALAMQLFGRSGAGALPFLNQGSAAIADLQKEARELGAVMSEDTIAAGDALGDNFGRLMEGLKGLRNLIVGPLFGAMARFVEGLVQWLRVNNKLIAAKVTPWLKAIGKGLYYVAELGGWLVTTFGKAALVIGAFFAAWKLGTLMMGATKVFSTVSWAIALVIGSLRTMTLAELQAAAAGALIPLAWIALAAAIFLAYDELRVFFNGGETLLGRFGTKWSNFLNSFLEVDADDWFITRWLKQALQALLDIQGTYQKLMATPAAKYVKHQMETYFRPAAMEELLQKYPQAAPQVAPQAAPSPAAAFGGGASPAASVANAPGSRLKAAPSATNVTVGDIHVHGTKDPAETAGRTVERLNTELNSVKKAAGK